MRFSVLLLALSLPVAAMASSSNEEKNDTTVVYKDKHVEISDSAGFTHVRVYDGQGNEYKPYYEGRFNDMSEEETFYITSPIYPKSYLRSIGKYASIVPTVFIGLGTMPGSTLGLANNSGLHLNGLMGSFETGISLLSVEETHGRKGWGMSYTMQVFGGGATFRKGYVLGNDEDMRTTVIESHAPGQRGYLTYLGMRMRMMVHYLLPLGKDRIGFGLGCSMEGHEMESTHWKKDDEKYRYAESAYLNMHPFGFGLDAQVSWNGIFLYAHKSLTPMFDTKVSPKSYPFTVGLGFCF